MLRALGDYGRLMVFPSNLHMERSVSDPASLLNRDSWRSSIRLEYLSLAGAAVLAVFAFGAFRKGAGQECAHFRRELVFAHLSSDLESFRTQRHRGGALALSSECRVFSFSSLASLFELPARFRRGAVALACLAVLALSARSAIRSSDWVDPETFYQRTFLAGGSSCRVGVNLAMLYSKRGEYGQSRNDLAKGASGLPGLSGRSQ